MCYSISEGLNRICSEDYTISFKETKKKYFCVEFFSPQKLEGQTSNLRILFIVYLIKISKFA